MQIEDAEIPTQTTEGLNETSDLISAGGPVVLLLIILSVIALTIVLYKLYQFLSTGVFRRAHIDRAVVLFRDGHAQEALSSVQEAKDPAARAMTAAIRGHLRCDIPEAAVREEVERIATTEMTKLRAHLSVLDLIGSLSPLLGLLGTVMGMIQAFRAMEEAGRNVDPAVLSGGIWAALLTTAAGLIVAIPVVAIVSWFERKIMNTALRTENAVTSIFAPDLNNHRPTETISKAKDEARNYSA